MLKGECNCGAVEFEIDSDISDVYVCHCSVCRKSSGNNGVAVIIVKNDALRWAPDAENYIVTWKKPDAEWLNTFCRVCGSPLPRINDELHMAVPAGLITEGEQHLKVVHHIWVDSKAAWDEIGDSGKQHPESFKS
jgi:hypothetical protein